MGFRDRMLPLLNDSWACTIFRPEPKRRPFESLCNRFVPSLLNGWGANLLDLCNQDDFQGRLIWIDNLEQLDRNDWLAWKEFLADYAQASRSISEFERTLFVASLGGSPPAEPPESDVTLETHDWRGVIHETDLLLLAYEQLGKRSISPTMRSLLATTVSRVAVWDFETAERLLYEDDDVILEPTHMLQSFAHEKGWTSETPVGWEYGTESGNGYSHAAIAALQYPPREIQRRAWSAQVSILLPLIDIWRRKIVKDNYEQLVAHLRSNGQESDPWDIQIGEMMSPILYRGFDRSIQDRVRRLHKWRNALAHLKPLPLNAMRSLVDL